MSLYTMAPQPFFSKSVLTNYALVLESLLSKVRKRVGMAVIKVRLVGSIINPWVENKIRDEMRALHTWFDMSDKLISWRLEGI